MSEKFDPATSDPGHDDTAGDLAQRLARYRRRLEAEGRRRSLGLIDRAINDAGGDAGGSL